MERSESVYGNVQKPSTVKKAEKSKQKYINKFVMIPAPTIQLKSLIMNTSGISLV